MSTHFWDENMLSRNLWLLSFSGRSNPKGFTFNLRRFISFKKFKFRRYVRRLNGNLFNRIAGTNYVSRRLTVHDLATQNYYTNYNHTLYGINVQSTDCVALLGVQMITITNKLFTTSTCENHLRTSLKDRCPFCIVGVGESTLFRDCVFMAASICWNIDLDCFEIPMQT